MSVNKKNSEFTVVWSGALERKGKTKISLVPDRETRVSETWTAPRRLYNKTGKHSKKIIEPKEPNAEENSPN